MTQTVGRQTFRSTLDTYVVENVFKIHIVYKLPAESRACTQMARYVFKVTSKFFARTSFQY